MSGRAKIPYASFKATLHAIKPQFISRRGLIGRISPQVRPLPNISARSPWWPPSRGPLLTPLANITLKLCSRTVVHVTQSRMYAQAVTHWSYVSVGDKVAGISIYLRAKAALFFLFVPVSLCLSFSLLLAVSPRFSFRSTSRCEKEGPAGCAGSLPSPR